MDESSGAIYMQNKAVALNRVANVLWRMSNVARPHKGKRMQLSVQELQTAYFSAYPSAYGEEFLAGLEELVNMGGAERLGDDVVFDLSRLG